MKMVENKLIELKEKFRDITEQLSKPEVITNLELYTELNKKYSWLSEVVEKDKELCFLRSEWEDNKELLNDPDPEVAELGQEEDERLSSQIEQSENELLILLVPPDPVDNKNAYLEIRAGTGGEEAALFAADLLRMYRRYAEKKRWIVEVVNQSLTGIGGFKEIIVSISGKGVYGALKYESGIHRVQRVPSTESSGRLHTSAVTVAIMPEAEDVEIKIAERDLRVDVYRSSGPGGQSVNTTDSAVRLTHLPTGLVVTCQDEKSQHKNKAKALKVLKARLLQLKINQQEEERRQLRKNQVKSGDRSEKIRTYNYPQARLSDHRINLTLYKLPMILDGDLDGVIEAVNTHFRMEQLLN